MDGGTIAQLATLVLAVMAIIWHQQRSIDKLRDDFNAANRELRDDFSAANREQREATDKQRDDFSAANREQREATDRLRDGVAENGQRLARIEGYLGIGIPAEAAAATGAAQPPGAAELPTRATEVPAST